MLFRGSIRAFLWSLLAILLLAVGAYLAIDLGILDWALDAGAEKWLNDKKKTLQSKYELKGETIDRALKIIGLAFTVVLGLLAFLRGWHFNAVNLPLRLQGYADRIKELHLLDRALVLAPYASRNLRGDVSPAPKPGRIRAVVSFFIPGLAFRLARQLLDSVPALDGDIKVLGAKLGVSKSQRITAHLLVASKLVVEARSLPSGSSVLASKCGAALSELRAARELDANDLDVLELEAKLARLLNTKQPLQKAVAEMERAAQKNPIRYARALRFQAELLEVRSTKAALNTARIKLETASRALDDPDVGAEKTLELALICEQLAALHLRRGTATLVAPYLEQAAQLFDQLPLPEKVAGLERIGVLRDQLEAAQRAEDEPEEPEERADAVVVPAATHVNSERLHIYDEPGEANQPVLALEPYTAIRVLSENSDWALIAKDGKQLGYVALSKLHELS
jgi:tetratricopeptide (TPR) repeat protein